MRSVGFSEGKHHPPPKLASTLNKPPALVSQVLGSQMRYHTRLIQPGGLYSILVNMNLGSADECP